MEHNDLWRMSHNEVYCIAFSFSFSFPFSFSSHSHSQISREFSFSFSLELSCLVVSSMYCVWMFVCLFVWMYACNVMHDTYVMIMICDTDNDEWYQLQVWFYFLCPCRTASLVDTYTHTQPQIHTYMLTSTHTLTYIHACIYLCLYLCLYVCV